MAPDKITGPDMGPIALAIMVAAVLFSAAFYFSPSKTQLLPQQGQRNYISVSADSEQEVAPDKVEITFGVISRGTDPSALQAENDAALRKIKEKLLSIGVPQANIKTVGYSLDRWSEYNKTLETYVDKGYELRNSLRVVSYDTSLSGRIIKEAVQNGANSVDGVQFMLSDSARKEIYGKLLKSATADAKSKAQDMASAAGVSLSGLAQMSESYGYVEPVANFNYKESSMAGAMAPDVSISAGLVRVRASVGATYEISG